MTHGRIESAVCVDWESKVFFFRQFHSPDVLKLTKMCCALCMFILVLRFRYLHNVHFSLADRSACHTHLWMASKATTVSESGRWGKGGGIKWESFPPFQNWKFTICEQINAISTKLCSFGNRTCSKLYFLSLQCSRYYALLSRCAIGYVCVMARSFTSSLARISQSEMDRREEKCFNSKKLFLLNEQAIN